MVAPKPESRRLGGPQAPGTAIIDETAQDLFKVVGMLFCRLEQRNLAERPGFSVVPGIGTEYTAEVGLRSVGGRPEARRQATGSSARHAVEKLRDDLAVELRLRIESDVGALELAGLPFDWSKGYGRHVAHVVDEPPLDATPRQTPIDIDALLGGGMLPASPRKLTR